MGLSFDLTLQGHS